MKINDLKNSTLSFITVNYNELQATCKLIESIQQYVTIPYEIIVVDNGSSLNPIPYLKSQYPEVMAIRSEKNTGYAGGNNIGIAASKGEFIFFVNNDVIVTAQAVEQMLSLFDEIPNLGVVSPIIKYSTPGITDLIQYAGSSEIHPLTGRNKTLGKLEYDEGQYDSTKPTAYANGAAMLVKRSVIEEVGVMPETFFLYYEELDWCETIKRGGFLIYVEPRAVVYHNESLSVKKMSTLKTFYLTRNRILFMQRNRNQIQFRLFFLFFFCFAVPKQILLYLFKRKYRHLLVFWKAATDHFYQKKLSQSEIFRLIGA